MIHFFDPGDPRVVSELPALAARADVLLGDLEDAVRADLEEQAREGLVRAAGELDLGQTALWARVTALDSPWFIDDVTCPVTEAGERIEVLMIPRSKDPRTSSSSTGSSPCWRPRPV